MCSIGREEVAVVFGYWRSIKYSVHALVGALESTGLDKDVHVFLFPLSELKNKIMVLRRKYDKVVYSQTLLTTELPEILDELKEVTKYSKENNVISIAGGPHASGDPYGTLISLGFDYVAVGEAEELFPQFISVVMSNVDPLAIRGIAGMDGSRVSIKGRGFVEDLDKYPPFAVRHRLFNPIEITRGCPFVCKYCQVPFIFSARPRHRTVDNVLRWVKILVGRGIKDIRFVTPNAFGYGSEGRELRVEAVTELLQSLQGSRSEGARIYFGTFPSEIRPEHVVKETVDLLRRYVDNKRVTLGAQTGSDRLLKSIGRGHTSEDVINAVRLLRNNGFQVDVDYIFGLPGETEEDVEFTIQHMKKVVSLGARVHGHVFLPLPGTPYSFSPPGRVGTRLRREINKLLGRGYVFGQWEKQEVLAARIAELRKRGVILITYERAKEILESSSSGKANG